MSQALEERTPQQELVARVRTPDFRSQIALALPEGESPDRFVRVLVTALNDNPALAGCEVASVFQAALRAAADGLLPDGREAAFVIFRDSKANVDKAQYLPMIGGFRKIAGENGWTIQTAVVYENDLFEFELGLEPKLRHVPVRPGADRGDIIAAYAVGSHRDGRRELEVMTTEDVEKVRGISRAKDRGPWVEWWERMAEKSVGRRLFKKLPLGDPVRQARIVQAAEMTAADATAAIYGPQARAALAPGEQVNPETGEVTSADPPADGEGLPDGPSGQQAEEATEVHPPPPPASSAPDLGDDPEPISEPTVLGGQYKGKTIAELVALGKKGEEWISWALRHPESRNVGPELHAALEAWATTKTEG